MKASENAIAITSEGEIPVEVDLHYTAERPYEVAVHMEGGHHGSALWVVSRDQMFAGLECHTGYHEVVFKPEGSRLLMHLTSPEGSVTIRMDWQWAADFLDATVDLVPFGSEVVDVDTAIRKLLDA